jgi:hypothetical protein
MRRKKRRGWVFIKGSEQIIPTNFEIYTNNEEDNLYKNGGIL